MTTKNSSCQRGAFLNIVLAVQMVLIIWSLFTLGQRPTLPKGIDMPSSFLALLPIEEVIGLIFGIVSLIGLYMWRKWGIYVFIADTILFLITITIMYFIVLSNNTKFMEHPSYMVLQYGFLGFYIFALILPVLILWAVKRKYSYFK